MSFDMSSATIGFAREAVLSCDAASAVGALQSLPNRSAEADYWLASALIAIGDRAEADAAMQAARIAHTLETVAAMGGDPARLQADRPYAAEIARKLYAGANVAMSSAAWALANRDGPDSAQSALSQALSLQHQARAEEAIAVLKAAVERWPSATLHQFMLYPHFMVEDGPARYAAEARRWAQLYAPASGAEPALTRAPLAGRRLRIGYVSPAFATTQIHQFIAPVLEAHDRSAVEVFLYPARSDGEHIWRAPVTVRPIGALSDEDAAELIRRDAIDVLVDCWGHSAGSRLPVFARRCAPVQVGWINFNQTTGLDRMDYILHGDHMAAPGTEALFTERVWHVAPITVPFSFAADRPPPQPTPALRTGQVTFGSFNHPVKLSDETVQGWARVLAGRPGSRLVLKYSYFTDPVLRRATQARFAAHGLDPDRIQFRGWSTGQDYLREFADIDLALDPSPCPGGTTTCDAMANSVPVLTLKGPDFYSRIGVQAMLPAGLPQLVAEDWDDYVAKALAFTADLAALDRLRAQVRPAIEASLYGDPVTFTRRLEAAFLEMAALKADGDREPARGAA